MGFRTLICSFNVWNQSNRYMVKASFEQNPTENDDERLRADVYASPSNHTAAEEKSLQRPKQQRPLALQSAKQ
jgi:predicted alternative tryptophan synthase beta-subunit